MGNAGGIVASQIYRSRDSPRFLLGHGITLGFCIVRIFRFLGSTRRVELSLFLLLVPPQPSLLLIQLFRFSLIVSQFCFFCSGTLHFLLKRENARRDRVYGRPPPPPILGEAYSPEILKQLGLSEMSEKEIMALGDDHPTFRFIT